MTATRVIVRCDDCSHVTTHDTLSAARVALDDHESRTGHAVSWRIESLADGVRRAGADAGVCGRPECAKADSPLVRVSRSDDDANSR
ncbi:MAG: DUF7542 family protein [Natrialbaceae archaeon]